RFKLTVGERTINLERRRLDTGSITRMVIDLRHLISMLFTPHNVHAVEHVCPVLTLGTPRTGIDFNYRTELILFTAEHLLEFEILDLLKRLGKLAVEFLFADIASLMKFV